MGLIWQEILVYKAVDLLCLREEVSLGFSYVTTLNWDFCFNILKRFIISYNNKPVKISLKNLTVINTNTL